MYVSESMYCDYYIYNLILSNVMRADSPEPPTPGNFFHTLKFPKIGLGIPPPSENKITLRNPPNQPPPPPGNIDRIRA